MRQSVWSHLSVPFLTISIEGPFAGYDLDLGDRIPIL